MLDKFAIAAALQEIASLLELKGGDNRFKARAYRAGARAIGGLSGDVRDLVEQNQLTSLRGIGSALASQIKQLYLSGSSSVLESLRKEFPPGVLELAAIPGLTLPKIRKLHESLGVTSLADLLQAAEAGKVRNLKGFGLKTERSLLESIRNQSKRARTSRRLHIHHAERVAGQLLDYLETARGFTEASVAGSLRRRRETVGVVRITAAAKNPKALMDHFLRFPLIVRTDERTENRCNVELLEGARVSLTVVKAEQYPVALLLTTGAKAHVERLQEIARGKRLLFDAEKFLLLPPKPQAKSEEDIYNRLHMQFVPPELRENEGEIEASLAGQIPQDLVTVED
ncbi:MAG: helix-hairpin-helix domain-containing protein, partial [Pyrinomonadaceae bacterium]